MSIAQHLCNSWASCYKWDHAVWRSFAKETAQHCYNNSSIPVSTIPQNCDSTTDPGITHSTTTFHWYSLGGATQQNFVTLSEEWFTAFVPQQCGYFAPNKQVSWSSVVQVSQRKHRLLHQHTYKRTSTKPRWLLPCHVIIISAFIYQLTEEVSTLRAPVIILQTCALAHSTLQMSQKNVCCWTSPKPLAW